MTGIYLQAAAPLTISGRLDLSAASRAKAHATASATARRDEARNAHGEWTRSGSGHEYTGDPLAAGREIAHPGDGPGLVVSADRDNERLSVFHPEDSSFRSYAYNPRSDAKPVPGIAGAAAILNSGGHLGDDPAGRSLKAGIGNWIGTGSEAGTGADDADEAFRQAVRTAPANAPALRRGLNGDGAAAKNAAREFAQLHDAQPGYQFHTGMASWTSDPAVSDLFARHGHSGGKQVTMVLAPGSKSLSIENHAGALASQAEWVSRGDFTVTGRQVGPDGTVILDVVQQ